MIDKQKNKKSSKQYGFVYFIVLIVVSALSYFLFKKLDNAAISISVFSLLSISSPLLFDDPVIASIISSLPPIAFSIFFKVNPITNIDLVILILMVTILSTFSTMWFHAKTELDKFSKENRNFKMQLIRLNKLKRDTTENSIENSNTSTKKILQLSNRILSLKQIANVLGSTLETKKVLVKICDACEKLLKAKSVSIYFISQKHLILRNRSGEESELPQKIEINSSESELINYLSKNYIMSSSSIKDDSVVNGIYRGSQLNFSIAGFLGTDKEKMGLLIIEEFENKELEDNDIQLFSILLNLASLSIRNSLLYQKVKKLANQDGLTKLFTKRYFENYMKLELARSKRHKKKFSLIMSDIDHFKNFNDEHGHQAGDFVLQQTAFTFKKTVRFTDLVCRYGGEEFIIILPETDLNGAYILAEKIRKKIESTTLDFEGKKLSVRVSLGISTYPDHGDNVKDLVKLCDNCLYHAKKTGRNKTVKYGPEIKDVSD